MSTTQPHPRRRAAAPSQVTQDLTAYLSLKPSCLTTNPSQDKGASLLRKGATFHTSSAPSSPAEDPVLNVRTLPVRSPTSPKALEDLVAASEKRVAEIIESFDRSFSGLTSGADDDLNDTEVLPVPSFLLAHAAISSDLMDIGDKKTTNKRAAAAAAAAATAKNNKDNKAAATNTDQQAQKLAPNATDDNENDDTTSVDEHRHASDSGLGSSIASTAAADDHADLTASSSSHPRIAHSPSSSTSSTTSVYSSLTATGISRSFSGLKVSAEGNTLSEYATKKVKTHIVNPILQEPTLEEYHSLVKELPQRIGQRAITCLRDLEKTLIFLAPVSADFSDGEGVLTHCFLRAKTKASSPASYLNFCEFSIQCIHTTVDHLNELDQRRPTDRPYTNTYFVDLVEQVRQYARIMAISRQKKAKGEKLTAMDYTPWVSQRNFDLFFDNLLTHYSGEKLRLRGGLSEDGKPAELVREKQDGKVLPIDAGHVDVTMGEYSDEEDLLIDEDVRRSMARKRKCDQGKEEYRACRECGKLFTRPCDLTKHEKTHSRPWKCPEADCKYNELGWPTEKERDRHVNDKHSDAPALFRCLYKPCAYTSKRESNCKQHMEKAHGWQYVRSKSKKSQSLVATQASPTTPLMPTPASGTAFPNLSTPTSPFGNSPATSNQQDFSEAGASPSVDGSISVMSANSNMMMPGLSTPSPAGYMGHIDANSGINFNGFGAGFTAHGMPYSPMLSEGGRRDSLATPGLSMTSNDSAAQPTFEAQFNFDDLAANNPWPSMAEWFPSYSMPQQPTPAWSDENFDEQAFNLKPTNFNDAQSFGGQKDSRLPVEFSPHAHGDVMLPQTGESQLEEIHAFHNLDSSSADDTDFTLYSTEAGESSAAGAAMFPDLGNVGGQFGVGGTDPMFDAMTDGDAIDQFTNISSMCPSNQSSQNYHN